MNSFLKIVAEDLYAKYGDDLSRTAVVFPNKRAGLFFNEHLAAQSDQPLWSPAYLSISELLQSLSTLRLADPVRLICELHTIFGQETQSDESLDDFYFWGELLISDFDDVDKNLVDADKLFLNLKNLKDIMDDFDFLDKEQEEAIQQFFLNFSIERHTELKLKFISMWDALKGIYDGFHERLTHLGIAYEGMLYRDAINKLDTDKLPYDKYVFVGFNVLNKVETKLFKELQNADKALFYWDYDIFYMDPHGNLGVAPRCEAGTFIRKNMEMFPSQLDGDVFNNLLQPKTVNYISASTENAQARYLPEWIRSTLTENEKENAIVLCNEALLLPVLHSIPEGVKNVNITMGFPLAQTPAYTFVDALLELQTTGYNSSTGRYTHATVQAVLKHPYTRSLSSNAETLEQELTKNNRFYPYPSELKKDDFLNLLFTPCHNIVGLCRYITELLKEVTVLYRRDEDADDVFSQLYRESLFKSYTIVNRIFSLMESGALSLKIETLKRLIHKMLAATNIPFHGEPAIGMQIMGVLETRNLDFKNLIILSLNEGLLPKGGGEASFVPYNLRKAFGMTTIEHRDALYAYYFYRLIQRAEHITLVHNTSSDGLNRGEASRFLLQFLIEWPHPIKKQFLEAGQSPQSHKPIEVEKTPEAMDRLYKLYSRGHGATSNISPSALNAYLDCRLKFYFRYVVRLAAPNEVNTEIDSSTFGSIFHRAVELIYKKLTETGKLIRKEDLENLLKSEVHIQQFVDMAFKELFFHVGADEKPEYNGTQLINSKVIATYVKQLLRNDLQYAPFEMVGMEEKVNESITIKSPEGNIQARIGGTIDRLDSKEDTLRIVDYKTGGTPKVPTSVEQLFTRSDSRPGYIFQTFLYAAIMCRKQNLKVAPSLLYIHRASSDTYSPVIEMGEPRKPKMPVNNFAFFEDEFRQRLQELLEEIYDPTVSFNQTEDTKLCEFCDYKSICKR
ncbi:PD-(D/E)XK nuclease family protein [Bacteroides sp. 51]|uniref:PD-(D/E)XK nuclease family protein n=1 Tax=Bacteroides sp. 51 TaxID=2302938 RepID=UPI0013D32B70|nr:PD-(D/E)XK nuclease family protein [Bacteroides sp. 51]NDV82737.1 PD-(D/E)XK nuclease family protein [Bacteroides sp. 51]